MTHHPHIINAYLESDTTILVKLSDPISTPLGTHDVTITDKTTGERLLVSAVDDANVSLSISSTVIATTLILVTLSCHPHVAHLLQIDLTGYQTNIVRPRNVLNSDTYFYTGDDLGNTFSPHETTFRVWAPTATDVQLLLYKDEGGPLSKQIAMQPDTHGTWCIDVMMNLENWYYLYQVTALGLIQNAVDPYVRAQTPNATRGMIIDLAKTNPIGWEKDRYKQLANPVDAVIYETHVRDFSIAKNSGMLHKGKYLAFTEMGTSGPENVATGVESLKQLGVSHVHILPVPDFASIDETQPDQYNWGYDPRNYNVPQGAYATTPHGTARIIEYKQMIQSLHQTGLGIVMDTVYNHTFVAHSDFDKIVPQYYYRTNNSGHLTNGSGVGNEIAAERPMVQKFIRDSVKYWVKEYHIDGLRFDLMALLSVDTMRKIAQDLQVINPSILLYGEAWTGGTSALPGKQLLLKGAQKGLGIGVFNDALRNGLCGSVFDRRAQGFASGAGGLIELIKDCIAGSSNEFTAAPSETINYASSHDNMTLWDKIAASNLMDDEARRIQMDELAQAVVLTSQGVPFIHGGEEFLRSKGGNDNSYNAGDKVNQLDWSLKAKHLEVFHYYAGLIHLRNHHPAFRMTTLKQIKQHLRFLDSPTNTIAFILGEHANGDSWKNILVIYNPNYEGIDFSLPVGIWKIVATRGVVNEVESGEVKAKITVEGTSCSILAQL